MFVEYLGIVWFQIDPKWVWVTPLIILDQFDISQNLHKYLGPLFHKPVIGRELFWKYGT